MGEGLGEKTALNLKLRFGGVYGQAPVHQTNSVPNGFQRMARMEGKGFSFPLRIGQGELPSTCLVTGLKPDQAARLDSANPVMDGVFKKRLQKKGRKRRRVRRVNLKSPLQTVTKTTLSFIENN